MRYVERNGRSGRPAALQGGRRKARSSCSWLGPVRAPKIDTIIDVTAKAIGVTKQDLESSCRKRQFAQPRQYAMYLARQLTKCSTRRSGGCSATAITTVCSRLPQDLGDGGPERAMSGNSASWNSASGRPRNSR
jgi:hypothetical protein